MKEVVVGGKKYLSLGRDQAYGFSRYLQSEHNIRTDVHMVSSGGTWPEDAGDVPTMTAGYLLEPVNQDEYDRLAPLYRLWAASQP